MSPPDSSARLPSAVRNKRRELTAAWLNTLASSTVTVGVLTPLAARFFGVSGSAGPVPTLTLALGVLIFLAAGMTLHLAARFLLKGFDP